MRFAILASILLALPVAAQAGDLSGRVYDSTALPVAGAVVSVGGQEVLTDADGAYSLAGLSSGEHEVAVALADGGVQRVYARVEETGTARRNVFLVSAAAMRGAQVFARDVDVPAAAPSMPVDPPIASDVAVAWQWRDSDA